MQIMKVIENMNKHPAMSVAENLRIAESIPYPTSSPRVMINKLTLQNYMGEEYKSHLLGQIEEKKREKELIKKKQLEDEMKDEMRVKRELQELSQKYQIEQNKNKPPPIIQEDEQNLHQQPDIQVNQVPLAQDGPIIQQSIIHQQHEHISPYDNQLPHNFNPQLHPSGMMNNRQMMNEYPTDEEFMHQEMQQSHLSPLKKQLQAQLSHFQKDLQRLQNQQKDMLKSYQKEVESLQNKKQGVIKELKNDQENNMKKQIQELQSALNSLTNQLQSNKGGDHSQLPRNMTQLNPDHQTNSMNSNNHQSFHTLQPQQKISHYQNIHGSHSLESINEDHSSQPPLRYQESLDIPISDFDPKQSIVSQKHKLQSKIPTLKKKGQQSSPNTAGKNNSGLHVQTSPPIKGNQGQQLNPATSKFQQNKSINVQNSPVIKKGGVQNSPQSKIGKGVSHAMTAKKPNKKIINANRAGNGYDEDHVIETEQEEDAQFYRDEDPLYNNENQIILTPKSQKNANYGPSPRNKFMERHSDNGVHGGHNRGRSIAEMMQGATNRLASEGNMPGGQLDSYIENPDERPIKPSSQYSSEQQRAEDKKRSGGRTKMQQLHGSTTRSAQSKKPLLTSTGQQPAGMAQLPPRQNTMGSVQNRGSTTDMPSISNLLKRVKSVEDNEEDDQYDQQNQSNLQSRNSNNPHQTSSILRKNSQRLGGTGRHSQKSVRIVDNFEQHQRPPEVPEYMNNQFFMGQQIQGMTEEAENDYLQQSRDFEKQYYEEILRPQKVKSNIESHQEPEALPGIIGGIKVVTEEELHQQTNPNVSQQYQQRAPNQQKQLPYQLPQDDSADMAAQSQRFTNFLFNKHLVDNDEEEQKVEDDFYSQRDQSPRLEAPDDRPQYQLREKQFEEIGSFKEYDSATAAGGGAIDMNKQLNEIQRIIQESSKMSEDAFNKNKEQKNKGYIEFNKSFQKNLKAVEDLFEDDKRKSHRGGNRTINSTINLSSIEEQKNASIQKPFFSRLPTPPSTKNRGHPLQKRTSDLDTGNPNARKPPLLPLQSQQDPRRVHTPAPEDLALFEPNQQTQVPEGEGLFSTIQEGEKPPQGQFHLLSFLLSKKQDQQQDKVDTPKHIKNLQQISRDVQARERQFQQQVMSHGTSPTRNQPQIQHYQQQVKHNLTPLQLAQINERRLSLPQQEDNLYYQQQELHSQMDQANQQYEQIALEQQNVRGLVQSQKQGKPPLPLIYQQKEKLQQALTQVLDMQTGVPNHLMHPVLMNFAGQAAAATDNSIDTAFNVFTENSHINEGRPPLNIYNPYFREEPPANKVYSKNDPFLINLNLRQKLNETNKMISVDNQNLLEKIQKMGKSIKPVQYGFPYIDLTKPDSLNNSDDNGGYYHQQSQATALRNNMQDFMKTKKERSTIDITDQVSANGQEIKLGDVSKYIGYNFNGENVLDIRNKIRNSQINLAQQYDPNDPTGKHHKLLTKANSYNNDLVKNIVDSKVRQESNRNFQESSINLGQIPVRQHQQILKNQKPYQEFLEYLKDDNVIDQPNGLRSIGEESKDNNTDNQNYTEFFSEGLINEIENRNQPLEDKSQLVSNYQKNYALFDQIEEESYQGTNHESKQKSSIPYSQLPLAQLKHYPNQMLAEEGIAYQPESFKSDRESAPAENRETVSNQPMYIDQQLAPGLLKKSTLIIDKIRTNQNYEDQMIGNNKNRTHSVGGMGGAQDTQMNFQKNNNINLEIDDNPSAYEM